jgi:hypothetical protein
MSEEEAGHPDGGQHDAHPADPQRLADQYQTKKKFYTSKIRCWFKHWRQPTTRPPFYVTFYVRNLRIFVISQSVCPWQAFSAGLTKHFSLVQIFVKNGRKKFYNIRPRAQFM